MLFWFSFWIEKKIDMFFCSADLKENAADLWWRFRIFPKFNQNFLSSVILKKETQNLGWRQGSTKLRGSLMSQLTGLQGLFPPWRPRPRTRSGFGSGYGSKTRSRSGAPGFQIVVSADVTKRFLRFSRFADYKRLEWFCGSSRTFQEFPGAVPGAVALVSELSSVYCLFARFRLRFWRFFESPTSWTRQACSATQWLKTQLQQQKLIFGSSNL